jgi:hypothetical protein
MMLRPDYSLSGHGGRRSRDPVSSEGGGAPYERASERLPMSPIYAHFAPKTGARVAQTPISELRQVKKAIRNSLLRKASLSGG